MWRAKRLLMVASATLALALCGVFVFHSGQTPITEEDVNRIENGMSRSEVEAILGLPRDQTTGPLLHTDEDPFCGFSRPTVDLVDRPVQHFTRFDRGLEQLCWCSDTLVFTVAFRDAHACQTTVYRTRRLPQSPLQNAIWRFKRQWRLWFADQ